MTYRDIRERLNKRKVVLWLIGLAVIVVAEIGLTVAIPLWREYFYNVLQLKQVAEFYPSLGWFAALMIGMGTVQGIKSWTGYKISFLIREALTKTLFRKWVVSNKTAPNYTQALTESIRNSTELYLEIVVEVIISAAIVVILVLSSLHSLPIITSALAYTLSMSALAVIFNKPLIRTDADAQKAEGAFREAISNISAGQNDYTYSAKWTEVVKTYYSYIKVQMNFTLFSRVKGSLASLIPYVLLASPFFTGAITLGEFMSGVATFELIVLNATILMSLYPKLTRARASKYITKEFSTYLTKERGND